MTLKTIRCMGAMFTCAEYCLMYCIWDSEMFPSKSNPRSHNAQHALARLVQCGYLTLVLLGISANVCCSASLNASVVQQLLPSHLSSSAVSQGFWDRGATYWAVIMKGHKGGGVLKLLYFTMKHAQPEQCHTRGTQSEAEVEFQMVSWPLRRQIFFSTALNGRWRSPLGIHVGFGLSHFVYFS